MSPVGTQRWLVAQSALWITFLLCSATGAVLPEVAVRGWLAIALMAASYAGLWWVLGAGRRIADGVTLARFAALLAGAAIATDSGQITWLAWAVLTLAVVADLADGWAARRWGGSAAGAVLDMETDQFATLALASLAHALAGVGAWILLLPAFRYVNVGALTWLGLPAHDPKPCAGDNRRGRLICALMLTLLLAVCLPIATPVVRGLCGGTAIALLAYSYAGDARFLWRHRRRAASAG